jgi:hypothetical protein
MSKIPLKLKTKVAGPTTSTVKAEMANQTWTFTFCESGENHVGMQILGTKAKEGFNLGDLQGAQKMAEVKGLKTELIPLHPNLPEGVSQQGMDAYVLVIREGWRLFFTDDEYEHFLTETKESEKVVDKHAWMKGGVKNKKARYNLCYADFSQKPNYEEKKGTVVDFKDVPYLTKVRQALPMLVGGKGNNLLAEMNYYYDITQTGIGMHGDAERKLVIGMRVGATMSLHHQWYQRFKPIGQCNIINLNGGDLYIMSDKSVGHDWKRSVIPTLRHAAGANKYTTPNKYTPPK